MLNLAPAQLALESRECRVFIFISFVVIVKQKQPEIVWRCPEGRALLNERQLIKTQTQKNDASYLHAAP